MILEFHGGEFPKQYENILDLPGVGRSTAAAISTQAFHEKRAILDGNVKRVLARYCGIHGHGKAVEDMLWETAESLLPDKDVGVYTQALMDMGAMLCRRSKPLCGSCPVKTGCVALNTGRVHELPTPKPKKKVPERHATFLLALSEGMILLEKRDPSGIWGGLWSLPQFEGGPDLQNWKVAEKTEMPPLVHSFTHFRLRISPLLLKLEEKPDHQREHIWMSLNEALQAAIPAPVRKLVASLDKAD
jgi:A/G-specific adenine glycosylase